METKDEKYDTNDQDEEYKYRQKPPKFNYVNYFINQMKQERNTPLQLTNKLHTKKESFISTSHI